MIQDKDTNFVYVSDTLKRYYKDVFNRLTKLFDKIGISWAEIPYTNDFWARDYMPIQLADNEFLLYQYYPDYLDNDNDRWSITDAHKACDALGIQYYETDLILDGGNITPCGDKYVMTSKAIPEGAIVEEIKKQLSTILGAEVVLIPWHKISEDEPFGHSDGFIHWCGSNKVLMSNHRNTDAKEANEIKEILENQGFEVTEMLFDDIPNQNFDYNWAYINYLQVGKKIIMPVFGISEDKKALDYIQNANSDCEVYTFRMRDIANNGGALHCITWNIKR